MATPSRNIYKYLNPTIVAAAFLLGLWAYGRMPERVATHWGANGTVNGYMSQFWGTFFLPLIMAGLYALFLIIPKIDPKTANIAKFRPYFDEFIAVLFGFLLYVYLLSLIWNLGHYVNFDRWIALGLAALCLAIGRLVGHSEPNWTIGVRTPWTLSDETVWRDTHKIAAKLFIAAGAVCLLGFIWPALSFWLIIGAIIGASLAAVVYSYFDYQRLHPAKK